MRKCSCVKLVCLSVFFLFYAPLMPATVAAPADWVPNWEPAAENNWWITQPESEITSPYYDSIPYWEIAPTLREIELTSNRVGVEVIGQSAEGRDLFLVIVARQDVLNDLGHQRAMRQLMVDDPLKAQEMLDQFNDFKIPIYVHASIHGIEYPGTDAALELIRTLAYSNDPMITHILDNVIFLVNPIANPDGRVHGTYENANGIQLNGDYLALSQPETRADVRIIRDWMPMVDLDLHGMDVNFMVIDPSTPPHNLNLEYDLYIKWALAQAQAMESSVYDHTGVSSTIPFRDWSAGWDDWGPVYQSQYSMYRGAIGATIETPIFGWYGVQAQYWAVLGALNYAVENRRGMICDQIEFMKRGVLGLPQQPIPQDILDQTKYKQYQTYVEFPEAYVIPATPPLQASPIDASYLVDMLLFHGIDVEKATAPFKIAGTSYPSGTYVVRMQQGLRGLANVLLSDGWDITNEFNNPYIIADQPAWTNPLLLGVSRTVVWDSFAARTVSVKHADLIEGAVISGGTAGFAYLPTTNEAIRATNDLLKRGLPLVRATAEFKDQGTTYGVGTLVIPGTVPGAASYASEIASRYDIKVFSLWKLPKAIQDIRMPRIAVDADPDFLFVLRDLGFPYDVVEWMELNNGVDLSSYDVYVQQGYASSASSGYVSPELTARGIATLQSFVKNGSNYIGMGWEGVEFAVDAGLADVTYKTGGWWDSGIARVRYSPGDLVSAQYPVNGYVYVWDPVWFIKYGSDMKVTATLASDNCLVAGYWSSSNTAAGHPIILWKTTGTSSVVLMGIDPTYNAYPTVTYRLVANSLYLG